MSIIVLYPCSQFDYLTSGRNESDVQQLFEAWLAAHHPAVLDQTLLDPAVHDMNKSIPRWETASYPPFNLQQDILIVPPCCESYWNEDWEKQSTDCIVIRRACSQDEIVEQILTAQNTSVPPFAVPLDGHHIEPRDAEEFTEEFTMDCYALAAARLFLALINKNVYYLAPDESRLKSALFLALQAYKDEKPDEVRQALQGAFDEIARAKDSYQSSQNYFIELTLVTETTFGKPLRQMLQQRLLSLQERADQESGHIDAQHSKPTPLNLFMPCRVLAILPDVEPETFSLLKLVTEQGNVSFIMDDGADDTDSAEMIDFPSDYPSLPLCSILDIADRILGGISLYRDLLGITPGVFGRLTGTLSPVLPQLLKLAEVKGVIHFSPLTGWKVAEEAQSKIVWQGQDNTSIDALLRYPIDPTSFLSFFELADQLGTQINQDSVPTSVFAFFPSQKKSRWLEILHRITTFTTGLGMFVSIEEYFDNTYYSGKLQHVDDETYLENTLQESGMNPLSRWHDRYRQTTERLVRSSLTTLLALLDKPAKEESSIPTLMQQFSRAVVPSQPTLGSNESQENSTGLLAINPLSFARKVYGNRIHLDVPPLGYAWIEPAVSTETSENKSLFEKSLLGKMQERIFGKKNKPVLARKAEDDLGNGQKRTVYLLENLYFSAKFDGSTGMLRSIFTNRSRFNQLSRQIACLHQQAYSISVADEAVITQASTELGQLTMSGRLLSPDGETTARWTETVTIRQHYRLLDFDLTIEPLLDWDENRWNSYLAVRYAWNDDTFEMRGLVNDSLQTLPARKRLYAPKMIDLRHEEFSLTFLSEGLPFHRRSGDRQLDTILLVQGETCRHFSLSIAVNASHPAALSSDFLFRQMERKIKGQERLQEGCLVPVSHQIDPSTGNNRSVWLFQIESHHVSALHWEPVEESGRLTGYLVYLQETSGRKAHFALRSFRPPTKAMAINLLGKEIKLFKTDADAVLIDMHAHELLPMMVWVTDG